MRFNLKIKRTAILAVLVGGALILAACSHDQNQVSQTQRHQIDKQNAITGNLVKNQPAPVLKYSADRAALIERYKRTADANFQQYIAVFTPYGQLLFTGTVKGKVTPLDSQLTPADGLDCEHYGGHDPRPDGCGVVQVAEPNGTWGTNGPGVFWFDPSGVMHETPFFYLLADKPFTATSQPLLTIQGETK